MTSPSPPPALQPLLTQDEDRDPSCVAPSGLLPRRRPANDDDANVPSVIIARQHKLMPPFRPSTSSSSSPRHLALGNDELASLSRALERARNEARHHSSVAQQLCRENRRLRAELELKNNQLDGILQKGRQDQNPEIVYLPGSPTSTLQDTEDVMRSAGVDVKNILAFNSTTKDDATSGDSITAQAVQTLLRNIDSFDLLSGEEEEEDGKTNALIGEELLSDDDSCSYSV
jgi:hypothetical protein